MLRRDILIEENYSGYKIIRSIEDDSDKMNAFKNRKKIHEISVLNGNQNEAEEKIKEMINDESNS